VSVSHVEPSPHPTRQRNDQGLPKPDSSGLASLIQEADCGKEELGVKKCDMSVAKGYGSLKSDLGGRERMTL
jgi:hypothetical protein